MSEKEAVSEVGYFYDIWRLLPLIGCAAASIADFSDHDSLTARLIEWNGMLDFETARSAHRTDHESFAL